MSLINSLTGTGVALVTPFDANENIDFNALKNLINFVINNGANYVVALGTTAETPVLEAQEKIDILNCVYNEVNGRVPVVVGIGGNCTKSVINDISKLPLAKATAILSASPYYNKPSQQGIYQHYKAIAEASPLPILLYNVPGRTGRNVTAATTIKLANEVPNIKGIKEAGDNMQQCMEIVRDAPKDFLVVSGDDALCCSQIALGFKGVISVAANCFPKQFCQMVNLSLQHKFTEATALHYKLLDGYGLLFEDNNPAGVKAFLAELGIVQNTFRLPVVPVNVALQQKIKQFLQAL